MGEAELLVQFPWTRLTRSALETVEPLLTPALLAHSQRAYAFAALYARRRRVEFDDEGLLAACLFHDVGLADGCRDRSGPFTRVGSGRLRQHLDRHGEPAARSDRLAAAIDLHFQLRPRWSEGPEVGLLQVGAWMDATGLRAWSVPRADRKAVNRALPRGRFQRDFQTRLVRVSTSPRAVAGLARPDQRRPMTDQDATRFVERFTEAWSARDPEMLAAVFHPGAVVRQPTVRRTFSAEEVAEYFRRVFAGMPGLRLSPLRWAARDEVVMIEWEATVGEGDDAVSWTGIDRFLVRDGLAYDEAVYFDTLPIWERLDPSMRRDGLVQLDDGPTPRPPTGAAVR